MRIDFHTSSVWLVKEWNSNMGVSAKANTARVSKRNINSGIRKSKQNMITELLNQDMGESSVT